MKIESVKIVKSLTLWSGHGPSLYLCCIKNSRIFRIFFFLLLCPCVCPFSDPGRPCCSAQGFIDAILCGGNYSINTSTKARDNKSEKQ